MTLAACLALYGLLIAVGAPSVLRHSEAGQAPRIGVLIWVATLAGAAAALVGAVVVVVSTVLLETGLQELLHGCLAVLDALGVGDVAPVVAGAVGGVVATVGGGWLLRAAWRAARTLSTARNTHIRLAARLRGVGMRVPALGSDILVVPSPERVVYCLAGRRRTVVVTSGALDALGEDEVAAVLAHERAHLAGRHHLVLVFARAVRRVMPPLPLFWDAEAEIARLLEMCADDTAARRHGRRPLLAALVALTDRPGPQAAPGILGAAGTAVLDRVHRLVDPASRADRVRTRRALAANLAALVLGPALALATMSLTVCPLVIG